MLKQHPRCSTFPIEYQQLPLLTDLFLTGTHSIRWFREKQGAYFLTVQSIDKALEKLEAKGYDTSGLLKKFEKLGISPVPLRKDFCAERLPNLVELLNTVGDKSSIVVPYTVIKYK